MLDKFMKAAKIKSEKEFLAKYPTEEHFMTMFPNFRENAMIDKAKSGITVTAEKWDPVSQQWVADTGVSTKQKNNSSVQSFEMLNNPYAGVFNLPQEPKFYTPFNEAHYEGILTPGYQQKQYNSSTNNWDLIGDVNKVELQPQYDSNWSNAQREGFEKTQPSNIGGYNTVKGKRKSRYSTEYDEYQAGGYIPYQMGGDLIPLQEQELLAQGNQTEMLSKAWNGQGGSANPWQTFNPNPQTSASAIQAQNYNWGQSSYFEQPKTPQPYTAPKQYEQPSEPKQSGSNDKISTDMNRAGDIMSNVANKLNNFTKSIITGGNYLAMNVLGQKQRDDRLDRPYQKANYNPFAYGTGSQAIAKDGIHIKPSHEGRFTEYKKRTGKTTEEALHSSDPHVRQMANFARNAAKWKHAEGGTLDNTTVHDGGDMELISTNPYTPETIQYNGQSHDDGGIVIDYKGNPVEVEGGETQTGNVVFGNMKVPGTNTKFKDASKQIAKEENSANKLLSKANTLLETEPVNAYRTLQANSGKIINEVADKKLQKAAMEKTQLATLQNAMLEAKENEKFMKNGGMMTAEKGKTMRTSFLSSDNELSQTVENNQINPEVAIDEQVMQAARKYGLDPNMLYAQIQAESGFKPGRTSKAGAKGVMQFMPQTAKQYGVDSILDSTKPEDITKVIDAGARYMKDLTTQFGGDQTLAMAAYNGGASNIKSNLKEYSRRTGKSFKDLTGQDWYNFMSTRKDLPKGQRETLDYVSKINQYSKDFDENPLVQYRKTYYDKPDLTPIQQPSIDVSSSSPTNTDFANFYTKQFQPNVYENLGQTTEESPVPTQPVQKEVVKNLPSLADRNHLGFSEIAPELGTLLHNINGPTYVQGQQYDPTLYTPYQVSFQDRLNENNAQLKAMEKLAYNNPSALATLAGQAYQANNSVLGEQFRTNQQISNDVINKNVNLINQADLQNISLRDQQYVRQAQAQANTQQQIFDAMSSMSNKFAKNKKENVDIRLKEQMFPNFRVSPDGKYVMEHQGQQYEYSPINNSFTPIIPTKTTEVTKNGDKTTKKEYVQGQTKVLKKWGGWI